MKEASAERWDGPGAGDVPTWTLRMEKVPIVPPLSALTRNDVKQGRVKTPAYLTWQSFAGGYFMAARAAFKKRQIKLPFTHGVEIELILPYVANADMDNRWKGLLDQLKAMNFIEDDCMRVIKSERTSWSIDVARDQMTVIITGEVDG
jgi:hypothetical protein